MRTLAAFYVFAHIPPGFMQGGYAGVQEMKKIALNKRTVANFSNATVLDQQATQHIAGASIDGSARPGQETWACPVTTSVIQCITVPNTRTFIQQR